MCSFLFLFFGEIDGYIYKSNRIKKGCRKVQITLNFLNRPFSFSFSFFIFFNFCALKAHVSIEQLPESLRLFLALFFSTANNSPNFMATSTKKFKLHILAPLSTWKNCKNFETLLYLMSCKWGCHKLQT